MLLPLLSNPGNTGGIWLTLFLWAMILTTLSRLIGMAILYLIWVLLRELGKLAALILLSLFARISYLRSGGNESSESANNQSGELPERAARGVIVP